jgi:hypothetical protein
LLPKLRDLRRRQEDWRTLIEAKDVVHLYYGYYTDLSHLMTAYYQENSSREQGFGRKGDATPPACPWNDRNTAVRRDLEVEAELERANQPVS